MLCEYRFGPNYLKHAQSFRAYGFNSDLDKNFSWGDKAKNGWSKCKRNNGDGPALHHACLELYETDGNINLLPGIYPGSRVLEDSDINHR